MRLMKESKGAKILINISLEENNYKHFLGFRKKFKRLLMIELLEKRHSVRSYESKPLSKELIDKIKSEVTFINSHEAGLNFQVVFSDGSPFSGFGRSYGMFRNVTNYIAAVIDPTFPNTEERAGYFAQQCVIELVKSGLGTCFVGGTFSRDNVNARVEVYEKIPFVVAFGYPEENKTTLMGKLTSKLAHRKNYKLSDFLTENQVSEEELRNCNIDLNLALRAVACAPSALNSKPVRLSTQILNGRPVIIAGVKDYAKNAVDLGIAKYNVANVLPGVWEWGNNEPFFID